MQGQGTGDKGQEGFPLEPALLDVTLSVGGRPVLHSFKPLTAADWLQYERLATSTSRRDGERIVTESMKPEAVDWLYTAKIDVVLIGGTVDFDPTRVPLPHREAAIDALARVDAAPGRDSTWMDIEQQILVRALRNGKVYEGLRHIFRPPTAKEHAEYSRSQARAVAVEVGKDRRMVACSNLDAKLELYDKLILRVEGYEPNDPRKMDALHKKVAVTALMEIALGNVEAPAFEPAGTAE